LLFLAMKKGCQIFAKLLKKKTFEITAHLFYSGPFAYVVLRYTRSIFSQRTVLAMLLSLPILQCSLNSYFWYRKQKISLATNLLKKIASSIYDSTHAWRDVF
jgi:hypothetical protein